MSMLIGTSYWWQDSGEIARLLRWLNAHDEHGPLDVDNCIEIVDKPHKWNAEYQEMCREQTEPGGIGKDEWPEDVIR